jgi:3'(2'), 5'-bisphosphate nucleotidase
MLDLIDSGCAAPGERFWTLDPVDGTKGFMRGDQYVVALALIVEERVVVGIIGCPALTPEGRAGSAHGWIACAARGGGARAVPLDGTPPEKSSRPLRVSSCCEPCGACVLRSFEAGHIDLQAFDEIVRRLKTKAAPTLMDSQAKHVLIASGWADLLFRVPAAESFRDKIWDQAAGSLIIEEAGGLVTDLHGAPLDFGTGRLLVRNQGLIASNRLLHPAALDAARDVIAARGVKARPLDVAE